MAGVHSSSPYLSQITSSKSAETSAWQLLPKKNYHCFGCDNLFTKTRAKMHYVLHTANTQTSIQHEVTRAENLAALPVSSTITTAATTITRSHGYSLWMFLRGEHRTTNEDIPQHRPNSSAAFIRPGSATDRLPCPYCSREFHPHSLKSHINTQHQSGTSRDTAGNNATATSHMTAWQTKHDSK